VNDIWVPWKPHEWIQPHYNFVQCNDFIKKIELLLAVPNSSKKLLIIFDFPIYMYRATYQPHASPVSIPKDHHCYNQWTFFKVIDSSYLQWLAEQSYGILEPQQYIHFSWITPQTIIDVISLEEPIIQNITIKP